MLPVWIWTKQGDRSHNWPLFAWILFFCLPIAGVFCMIFGVFASDQRLDSSNSNYFVPRGSGLAGLAIALLAYPLYIVLKSIKHKKTSHK
jgi:uncharacterized membrane protein